MHRFSMHTIVWVEVGRSNTSMWETFRFYG
jgi:hypothetical protein